MTPDVEILSKPTRLTVLDETEKNSGILYDPTVAAACLRLFQEKGYRFTN